MPTLMSKAVALERLGFLPMLPLYGLAIATGDSMAIAKLTLSNKGPTTELAVAFRPGALAVL
jgi:hypothetical protein